MESTAHKFVNALTELIVTIFLAIALVSISTNFLLFFI